MEQLNKFVAAQESTYSVALAEIKNGRKQTHWMWYIFPQIRGLGYSETSQFYALEHLEQAQQYLKHPVLGKRLVEISSALLDLPGDNATSIFGKPDDLKLKSSMTLFAEVPNTIPVFQKVLEKFFEGKKDPQTLEKLKQELN
ncbi:DUF1810 domain-containing protein [Antarcticibacterium sp. 1MA-6-2]|uniref:DUF1810 domain-containing protein n=1 Tax=Antarcticibacterium sp. 1MA-6-2 TaxID=2908210 RepID=UPI001F1E8487|nr:DUF1810 domain-containing protein [Antarcticibacterium sp. 1MA-6-2]UJH92164.1 DUF1810 domain-containing protein [Antarcticibacterium sp. 1MA-6-2]